MPAIKAADKLWEVAFHGFLQVPPPLNGGSFIRISFVSRAGEGRTGRRGRQWAGGARLGGTRDFSVNPPEQRTYPRVDEIPNPDRPAAPLPPDRQEEFVRLLNGAHALLLRYIMSIVGNRHDAEDVLQSASVVMWRRFGTFEPGTNFVAWASTIAFYEVRNFQRVTGRSRVEFDDELMKTLAAERATHVLEWPARMSALEICTQKLDAADRALIQAIYLEGREIGATRAKFGPGSADALQ